MTDGKASLDLLFSIGAEVEFSCNTNYATENDMKATCTLDEDNTVSWDYTLATCSWGKCLLCSESNLFSSPGT